MGTLCSIKLSFVNTKTKKTIESPELSTITAQTGTFKTIKIDPRKTIRAVSVRSVEG